MSPYHRDRNHLLVAAEGGFGAVNLGQIDWQSEVTAPVGVFFSIETDPRQMVASWLRTTAEQALYYRDHQAEFEKRYAGHYILLQMGQVRWFGADVTAQASRRCQVRRTRGAGWRWTASLRWSEIYQDGRMSEDSIERFAVARAQLTPVSLR